MALSATTIIDVRTTGSDTLNGGMFDPGQTAGMFADLTVTSGGDARISSPVVKSASYNFVAGDVGAWLWILAGTNWFNGLWQIESVASNEATLSAAIGVGYLSVNKNPNAITTAAGVATVQTPTAGTWTIDYSQQNAAQFAYTDLASVGAGLLVSSVALPFGKQQVGNALVITGGTNFTAGRYVLASVAAGVATVVGPGNITTGAGVSGTGGLGGALASPGMAGGVKVAGADVFIKSGTYTIASTSANIATGKVSDTTGGVSDTNFSFWVGWNSVRTVNNIDATRPLLQVASSGVTGITVFAVTGSAFYIKNIDVDGQSKSTITGLTLGGGGLASHASRIKVTNTTVKGFNLTSGSSPAYVYAYLVESSGCSGTSAISGNATFICCYAHDNTASGVVDEGGANFIYCISDSNSGASSDGFSLGQFLAGRVFNCVAYNNGRSGFNLQGGANYGAVFVNCIAYGNAVYGFASSVLKDAVIAINCAAGNNTTANVQTANLISFNVTALSADPFVDAPGGNFALNSTAGGGASCRAAGTPGVYPGGLSTGYLDIGAVQHADSGGGGIARLIGGGLIH